MINAINQFSFLIALQSRTIGLTKPVARVRYGERPVLLSRYLDPIRGPIVRGGRRRAGAGLRSRNRGDRNRVLRFVNGVRDEHSGHGVFLSAQLGEVNLP